MDLRAARRFSTKRKRVFPPFFAPALRSENSCFSCASRTSRHRGELQKGSEKEGKEREEEEEEEDDDDDEDDEQEEEEVEEEEDEEEDDDDD